LFVYIPNNNITYKISEHFMQELEICDTIL